MNTLLPKRIFAWAIAFYAVFKAMTAFIILCSTLAELVNSDFELLSQILYFGFDQIWETFLQYISFEYQTE